jgi:GGDEF domain-containing protein
LRLAISGKGVVCEGREVRIAASAGLAEAHSDDAACDWIKRADVALYAAKDAGRDCGFLAVEGGVEPLDNTQKDAGGDSPAEPAATRAASEAAADLAAESFADTSFVQSIAKRIAEWRRGGATLTVILAELDPLADDDSDEAASEPRPIRLAMQWARGCVREMDLVTRWKKRGLAILLPCTTAADAKTVARRMRSALALHGASHAEDQALSLSIGIAEGIEGNDAKRVLERAWLALETAKVAGPAGVCVHDGVKTVCVKRMAMAKA